MKTTVLSPKNKILLLIHFSVFYCYLFIGRWCTWGKLCRWLSIYSLRYHQLLTHSR